MILLADQPYVNSDMLNELLQRYRVSSAKYIAAAHLGLPQPPVIFDKELFGELGKLKGDEGARKILRCLELEGLVVEYSNPLLFFDVDTKATYDTLTHFE